MRRIGSLLVALLVLGCLSTPSEALQKVALHATLTPNKLGVRTTIRFGFQIHGATAGRVPSPVTAVDLHFPAGMGLATSTLGLANCDPRALLEQGPEGCPANARIGFGSALVTVPVEDEIAHETAIVNTVIGPPNHEHLEVLFYVEGNHPVFAQLVFPSYVLSDADPFSGRLDTAIPPIPTWPGGSNVALTSLASTIGPLGLTYYKHLHGKVVGYRPKGIEIPRTCPRKGFLFRADFRFLDGAHASAGTRVPCSK